MGAWALEMAVVSPIISSDDGKLAGRWASRFGGGMRAVVQRVSFATVTVDGADGSEVVGSIGPGLLLLVCAMEGDTDEDVAWLVQKVPQLRIFADADGRMNLSLLQREPGERGLLVVSQFTLSADLGPGVSKGNRPSFTAAMAPGPAAVVIDHLMERLREGGCTVAGGRFGASMRVRLENDGPVTLWLDTRGGRTGGVSPSV
jgi:D-aminoacyl-tRNA deacylase